MSNNEQTNDEKAVSDAVELKAVENIDEGADKEGTASGESQLEELQRQLYAAQLQLVQQNQLIEKLKNIIVSAQIETFDARVAQAMRKAPTE